MSDEISVDASRSSILRRIIDLTSALQEGSETYIPYRDVLLSLLADAETLVSTRSQEVGRLRQVAFGLFRIVTDSWELEKSPMGQDLLALGADLRAYVLSIEGSRG